MGFLLFEGLLGRAHAGIRVARDIWEAVLDLLVVLPVARGRCGQQATLVRVLPQHLPELLLCLQLVSHPLLQPIHRCVELLLLVAVLILQEDYLIVE